ncbi:SLAM family member 9-like [Aquila chrysaetos chrysaetos]|uniref:SLAM family member 9-like n=1 Tax=Aquila chrysaetos chrysaetos TaxID=223781 RepID=UPI0011772894|nr:SLAM family member 9-like [Aquila chrysaetos chrysaetos]XP_040981936.1 SLAM family member 9-like [Aquila chrysaetos chrysaetos]
MPECECGTPQLCAFICCCMRRQQGLRMGRHRVCLFGVALLTAAAGFAAWAQPQQVNGVLGVSVLLSPALPPNKMVKEIEWSFSNGDGASIRVAEFGPGSFEHPNPKDRFKDELEMFNKTALKIRALERGDSGVYGARIKLQPALVEDPFFNLFISEPLPDPEIQSWLLSRSPMWCHLMLWCHIPSGAGGTIIWMKPRGEPGGCQGASPLQQCAPCWGAAQLPQHHPHLQGLA